MFQVTLTNHKEVTRDVEKCHCLDLHSLGFYTAYNGSSLLMFRENVLVLFLGF